jgi:RNA polymerase primary sigma factor
MAIKNSMLPEKDEGGAPEEDPETPPDSPLLDLSDAAVRKMIKQAKNRSYVTYEEFNSVVVSEEVASEQIQDILAMLNEMGINVIETEEASGRPPCCVLTERN